MRCWWQIHTCSLFSQLEELILSSAGNNTVGGDGTGGTDLSLHTTLPLISLYAFHSQSHCLLSNFLFYLQVIFLVLLLFFLVPVYSLWVSELCVCVLAHLVWWTVELYIAMWLNLSTSIRHLSYWQLKNPRNKVSLTYFCRNLWGDNHRVVNIFLKFGSHSPVVCWSHSYSTEYSDVRNRKTKLNRTSGGSFYRFCAECYKLGKLLNFGYAEVKWWLKKIPWTVKWARLPLNLEDTKIQMKDSFIQAVSGWCEWISVAPWGIVSPCYTASGAREINRPGPSMASGLHLFSTITSNVLSSTASGDTDNGVFEEVETLKAKERGYSVCDDTEWADQKCKNNWTWKRAVVGKRRAKQIQTQSRGSNNGATMTTDDKWSAEKAHGWVDG